MAVGFGSQEVRVTVKSNATMREVKEVWLSVLRGSVGAVRPWRRNARSRRMGDLRACSDLVQGHLVKNKVRFARK